MLFSWPDMPTSTANLQAMIGRGGHGGSAACEPQHSRQPAQSAWTRANRKEQLQQQRQKQQQLLQQLLLQQQDTAGETSRPAGGAAATAAAAALPHQNSVSHAAG